MIETVPDEWLPWQDRIDNDPHRIVEVSGGLGCGKTNLIAKLAIGRRLKYPGSRGVILADTFEQIERSINFEIATRCRELKLRAKPGGRERPWRFDNGSEIWFDSYQKSAADYKGPEWDDAILDEADNKDLTEEKFDMIDGRVGRNKRSAAHAKVFVFCNPVSHGHFIYQRAREMRMRGYVLHEISTYENRRFLADGYLENQEAKHPPGTPSHDRYMLGKCGIPHPLAVYRYFKYQRDRIEQADFDKLPVIFYRDAMHLHDGQPVGWLRVAMCAGNLAVPVKGKLWHGHSPDRIASDIREIMAANNWRLSRPVLADRDHALYRLLQRAGLRMAPARTDMGLGIGRLRNRIPDHLKLLRREDGRCATPELLVDLEEHKTDDKGKVEEEQWSQVRPLEYIAVAHNIVTGAERSAAAALGQGFAAGAKPAGPAGMFLVDNRLPRR
ncbi:MAG: hypothetical protein IT464_12885 [Planctomycetes bacterium]|nr:hypothetical protein [Planctomycetota bacterium]